VSTKAKARYEVRETGSALAARLVPPARRSVAIYLFALFAGLVVFCAILLVADNVLSIGFAFEKNYNEGWNVYNTERFFNHELIYDANYWRVNNYPIGSFLVIAATDLLVDNLLLSGRIVALISLATIAVLAAVATRRFGGDHLDAVFGGGCALGFCYLVAPSWLIVDDPQSLGEAVMLGALVSYISRPLDRLSLLRTAFLVALAGFTKHNLVAIPVAITLDLALRSPRRMPFWLACCGGFAVGFLGLTQVVAGGSFIEHLLSPRIFTWYGVRYHLMKYLRLFKFPLVAIIFGSRLVCSGDRGVLAAWGIVSVAVAAIFSGFEGTSYNMFQDAAVFLGVAAGIMLYELRLHIAASGDVHGRFTQVVVGVLALLLAQPILARTPDAVVKVFDGRTLLDSNRRAEEAFLADARYIAERPGPAICESLLLCYMAGKSFVLDPFNSRQYILAGKLDEGELIRRIVAREFGVIQVRADICDDPETASCHILHYPQKFNRFTDETLYTIDRYYRVGRRSRDGTFYVPN
jgi:hypothetical protein